MATRIIGTGCYIPERTVTNADLVRRGLDTSDAWIVAHTCISERRYARDDQATSDLAVEAAHRALSAARISADCIDLIICATSSPDHLLPSTASIVQGRLGAPAGAFDVNAGCSGFPYALSLGFAMQATGDFRHVLVIGSDTYSRLLNHADRGSSIFFGDGAGAVVLGSQDGEPCLLATTHGSDGRGAREIWVPAGGSRLPATEQAARDRLTCFRMNGRNVWDFAFDRVPRAVEEVVKKAGLSVSDIDLLIPHQANGMMLKACVEQLGLPHERLFTNLERYGNTAAASIPTALDEAVRAGRLQDGDHVVLVGFGAGLTWSAVCLRWWNPGRD